MVRLTSIRIVSESFYKEIFVTAILTEGIDLPNTDCIMIARPTKSPNLFFQMVGRGMRISSATGKNDCRVIDLVDSLERVGGVMSGPVLFQQEADEIIDSDGKPS